MIKQILQLGEQLDLLRCGFKLGLRILSFVNEINGGDGVDVGWQGDDGGCVGSVGGVLGVERGRRCDEEGKNGGEDHQFGVGFELHGYMMMFLGEVYNPDPGVKNI